MKPCKFCSASIYWKVIGGRPFAHNPAGERHYCMRPTIKVPFQTKRGDTFRGADYKPSCGECAVPPWEPCACSS